MVFSENIFSNPFQMSILHSKSLWLLSNRAEKLLSLVRKITTFPPKFDALSNPSLSVDSYCEEKENDRIYLMNRNIDSLIKSGRFDSALKVFDEMLQRDVVTYNLIISGHRRNGLQSNALWFYAEMVSRGIRESSSTFASVLGICADAGFYKQGIQVHCRAVSLGLSSNVFIRSAVINLQLQMGRGDLALKLFKKFPERNLATWNLMLRGLCDIDGIDDMLGLFSRMKWDDFEPNGLTFSYLIRGCANGRFFDEGKQFHCHVIKVGWVVKNIFVANALVDFYSACESSIDARRAFEAIPVKDVISWNSIVWVCANDGLVLDSLKLFSAMRFWGNRPSTRSIIGLLSLACGTENSKLGKQIHSCALKSGFDCGNAHIQSALINMYGKCGELERSVEIYRSVEEKTLGCCNSLMTSLLHCNCVEDAIEMFGLMIDDGIGMDEVTLSTALKAVSLSSSMSSKTFESLHSCAVKSGLGFDAAVSSSLIDAYSKTGRIELSRRVFEDLHTPNAICFTSIINGYARNGMGNVSLNLFRAMTRNGLKPDRVTFLCVLTGCNHSGLVTEGKKLFESMKNLYNITPDREHYSCMVDLLGRAGLLDEAEELIKRGPGIRDSTMWSSLLRSCRVHKNENLGRRAAKILLEIEPGNSAIGLQVSSFYSEIGEFSMATEIREIAMARKVMREIGHSLIEN